MRDITLKNAWENRGEVVRRCEKKEACEEEFDKLKTAIEELNEEEYIQILRNNFSWCNEWNILQYNFTFASNFIGGFARVQVNDKWGFIKENGDYLIEPEFDYCSNFNKRRAIVIINGERGFIQIINEENCEFSFCKNEIYQYER